MSLIVTDKGFAPDDWQNGFQTLEAVGAGASCVDCGIEIRPEDEIHAHRAEIMAAKLIRVAVTGFADGRGFTIARSLRLMGYGGRLRAGPGLIADQYAMARRAGFDEVEIDESLSLRQPEADWLFRAVWRAYDHQSRLRG